MDPKFFEQPIPNSPYEYPSRHWELDASGQPTNTILREHREGRVHLGDPGGEEAPRGSARDGLRRGRWAFAELTDVYAMEEGFEGALEAEFHVLVERAAP